jgi:hypothetical protein
MANELKRAQGVDRFEAASRKRAKVLCNAEPTTEKQQLRAGAAAGEAYLVNDQVLAVDRAAPNYNPDLQAPPAEQFTVLPANPYQNALDQLHRILQVSAAALAVVRLPSDYEKARRARTFKRYRDATKGLQTDAARNYHLVTALELEDADPAAVLALPIGVGPAGGVVAPWFPDEFAGVELAARARLRNSFPSLEFFDVPTGSAATSTDPRVPELQERLHGVFNWLEATCAALRNQHLLPQPETAEYYVKNVEWLPGCIGVDVTARWNWRQFMAQAQALQPYRLRIVETSPTDAQRLFFVAAGDGDVSPPLPFEDEQVRWSFATQRFVTA